MRQMRPAIVRRFRPKRLLRVDQDIFQKHLRGQVRFQGATIDQDLSPFLSSGRVVFNQKAR